MKKFILIFVCIVVFGVSIATIIMSRQSDAGYKGITTYEEHVRWVVNYQENNDITLKGLGYPSKSEEEAKEFYENNENFIKVSKGNAAFMHGEFCAMLVEAGEDYLPYTGTFEQNAIIKEVYAGCKYEVDTEISLVQMGGVNISSDTDEVSIQFAYQNLPMVPGEEYLVFCEETELSYEMERPQFRTYAGANSIVSVDNDSVLVVDENTSVEDIFNAGIATKDAYGADYYEEYRKIILQNYGLYEEK